MRLFIVDLLIWAALIVEAKPVDKEEKPLDSEANKKLEPAFGSQPCMDLTDNCVALIVKGICQTRSSRLCSLSCHQCLPPLDNINQQPFRTVAGVDPRNPPDHKWPSPLPPDPKDFPFPESSKQKPDVVKKDRHLDGHVGDHPEDGYPNSNGDRFPRPDFDPSKPVPLEASQTEKKEDTEDQKRSDPIPTQVYDPDENIPFPRSEDDQFIYPAGFEPRQPGDFNPKNLRQKRQVEHPPKENQFQNRDPNDPFPFPHRDPDSHFPPPVSNQNKEQIYPPPKHEPDQHFPLPHPTPIKPIPYPLNNPDENNPFWWDPARHVPGHRPIPSGQIPISGGPDGQAPIPETPNGLPIPRSPDWPTPDGQTPYDNIPSDSNDGFPFPHRDPTDQRPFPHYNPNDDRPIPHFDPRDQIPRPHQNPGFNGVDGKLPEKDDDKKPPTQEIFNHPDSDIFKLSNSHRQKRQIPQLKNFFQPYSSSSSSEETDPRPYSNRIPPLHTGPNHQIPTPNRHRRKPRHGDKRKGQNTKNDDKGVDNNQNGKSRGTDDNQFEQTPESASVYTLPENDLHKKSEAPPDEYPGPVTDITNHQIPNPIKVKNDEGIQRKDSSVLYDDPYLSPEEVDPTVVEHQLDEPLKKDQFPYPYKKIHEDTKLPSGSKLPDDISHLPEGHSNPTPTARKRDYEDQWQEGQFPDSVEVDRRKRLGNLKRSRNDQYPYPDIIKIDRRRRSQGDNLKRDQYPDTKSKSDSGLKPDIKPRKTEHQQQLGSTFGTFGQIDLMNPLLNTFGTGYMNPMGTMNPYMTNPMGGMNPYMMNPMGAMNPYMTNPMGAMNPYMTNPMGGMMPGRMPFWQFTGKDKENGANLPGRKQPNTEGGEQKGGRGKKPKKSGHSDKPIESDPKTSKASKNVPNPHSKLFHGSTNPTHFGHGLTNPVKRQIPSPDDIKDPKEGPSDFVDHPKNIKTDGPHGSIPVPDEIPSEPEQSHRRSKRNAHHFPRPTPARPLPDSDDPNPFDQWL